MVSGDPEERHGEHLGSFLDDLLKIDRVWPWLHAWRPSPLMCCHALHTTPCTTS